MERVYTLKEVAAILSLDIRTIYSYIRKGRLSAARFGRVYRVTERQLAEFMSGGLSRDQKVSDEELNKIVNELKEKYQPEKIILFGSMSQGKRQAGDIDLVIIKKTTKNFFDRLKEIIDICDYDKPVDFLVYTPEEFEEEIRDNPFVRREIAQKGKVLYEQKAA